MIRKGNKLIGSNVRNWISINWNSRRDREWKVFYLITDIGAFFLRNFGPAKAHGKGCWVRILSQGILDGFFALISSNMSVWVEKAKNMRKRGRECGRIVKSENVEICYDDATTTFEAIAESVRRHFVVIVGPVFAVATSPQTSFRHRKWRCLSHDVSKSKKLESFFDGIWRLWAT